MSDGPAAPQPAPAVVPPTLPLRLNLLNVSLAVFAIAVIFSMPALKGSGRELNYLANIQRFASKCFPPDFSVTGDALRALGETFQISVLATFFAILLAFPIGLAGASTFSPKWLVVIVRVVMNLIRTIHALLWVTLAVVLVGPNPLAGVIALTFYSLAYLGKFYSDAFESLDMTVAEGLRASGASPIQTFQHSLWPQAKPLIWSYSLWMLEYNIRTASIIGLIGVGGTGLLLHSYQEYGQWDRFMAVLLILLVPVMLLDLLGEWVRSKITRRPKKAE